MRIGPSPIIVTSNPRDIVQINSGSEQLVRPAMLLKLFTLVAPGGLFSMDKHIHLATRKTLRENFHHSMLRDFHKHMALAIQELCEALDKEALPHSSTTEPPRVDISHQLSVTTFRVITNVAFGFSLDRQQRLEMSHTLDILLVEMMKEVVQQQFRTLFQSFGTRKRLFAARDKIRSLCSTFIEHRLRETSEARKVRPRDMLDAVLSVEHLTEEAAISLVMEFALAGFHTTNQMLAWTIYEVCCNRQIEQKLNQEIDTNFGHLPLDQPLEYENLEQLKYLSAVWKESLRVHAVTTGSSRIALQDYTLQGSKTVISKGYGIFAHRARVQIHEKIWKDPLSFNPERWGSAQEQREGDRVPPGAYAPFGTGPRNCLGRFLAEYEGSFILAELYRRYSFSLTCEPDEIVNCSIFVTTPRTPSKKGGPLDMGVPVHIRRRRRM